MPGWIKLHRDMLDSKLWSCSDATFRVAMYLLLSANHKEKYHRRIKIKRGQCIRSLTMISEDCGVSKKAVRHALKILKSDKFIAIDEPFGAHRGSRITILKYDKYQSEDNTEGHTEVPAEVPAEVIQTRKEEGNNGSTIYPYQEERYWELIEGQWLNTVTGETVPAAGPFGGGEPWLN